MGDWQTAKPPGAAKPARTGARSTLASARTSPTPATTGASPMLATSGLGNAAVTALMQAQPSPAQAPYDPKALPTLLSVKGRLNNSLLAQVIDAQSEALAAHKKQDPHGEVVALKRTSDHTVRLPVDVGTLMTVDARPAGGRVRRPSALRLDWTSGSGDRSIGPARVATTARSTRLTGSLRGFRPLEWAVPVSGATGMLTPDVACKLRVGRVDLARGGSDATVTVIDGVVSLTITFAGGQIRLVGTLTEQGDAPADWDAEVELDHRRCARLLAPRRGRSTGEQSAVATADEPPPDDEPTDGRSSSDDTPAAPRDAAFG